MQESQKGFFDSMNPKAGFIFGIVSGIALVSVLLVAGLLGGGISLTTKSTSTNLSDNAADSGSKPTSTSGPTARTAGAVPVVTDADHIRGDANAPLTWIEYSDFECPFCKRFAPTMQSMMADYDGKIRFVYRHFPLSFHANAEKEAEASECANELGGSDAFWEYHDKIFERTSSNGTGFALADLAPLAKEIGLNESDFQSCLDSGKYASHVQDDLSAGSAAGVTGTPGSFFVDADGNAQLISGAVPYSQVKAIIDAALK